MELEDLKKNWELVEKRLERLEQQQEQEQQHRGRRQPDYDAMQDTVKRMKRRIGWQSSILCLVPLNFWLASQNYTGGLFSTWTWAIITLFIGVGAAKLIYRWRLLERLDSQHLPVREACIAANRFRQSFKTGTMFGIACALPLLVSIWLDFSSAGDAQVSKYLQEGFLAGLLIGIPLGVRVFLRAWREVKELQRQVEEL